MTKKYKEWFTPEAREEYWQELCKDKDARIAELEWARDNGKTLLQMVADRDNRIADLEKAREICSQCGEPNEDCCIN